MVEAIYYVLPCDTITTEHLASRSKHKATKETPSFFFTNMNKYVYAMMKVSSSSLKYLVL